MIVSASIVLYKSDFNEIKKITLDILKYQKRELFNLKILELLKQGHQSI